MKTFLFIGCAVCFPCLLSDISAPSQRALLVVGGPLTLWVRVTIFLDSWWPNSCMTRMRRLCPARLRPSRWTTSWPRCRRLSSPASARLPREVGAASPELRAWGPAMRKESEEAGFPLRWDEVKRSELFSFLRACVCLFSPWCGRLGLI